MKGKIERNVFGEIEYTMGPFFVPHRKGCTGQYAILKREAWSVVDPIWLIEDSIVSPVWFNPPTFDSYIRAVAWMKEHIEELI